MLFSHFEFENYIEQSYGIKFKQRELSLWTNTTENEKESEEQVI